MKRLCIYATIGGPAEQVRGRYVPYMLRHLKEVADRLIVVTDIAADHAQFAEIEQIADVLVRSNAPKIRHTLDGYRLGLEAVGAEELQTYDEVLFVDTSCYGPLSPLRPVLDDPQRSLVDFWSLGFFGKNVEQGVHEKFKRDRIVQLNFFSANRRVVASPAFQKFMRKKRKRPGGLLINEHALHLALERAGFKWGSFIGPGNSQSTNPLLFEAANLVRSGCPIVLETVFTTDPLHVDMQAIEGRAALEAIEETTRFDQMMIWESLLLHQPLRLIQSNMDDLRIFESAPGEAAKKQWDFGGKVAVAAHVFYVDMLPEFCELVSNLPCDFDFFITTSTQEHKRKIEEQLQSFDCGGRKEVRVVAQNRGRDMSSLFITFRDVMLSGDYAWVLRLHSKRTPQMPWQVGQSFKRHLIQSLVPSKRFVTSLFDLLQQPGYRNVGIVAPPVVHIGFGTLGHSWYANKKPAANLARQMGITVPLDSDTPVATYGTMYWFRPKALEPMFRYDWKWEDYNAEPNHIDGGLAHVQERLLCYCAQQQGYRTLAVMSAEQAARNYLKLEYKHQALSSCFIERDVRAQYRMARKVKWHRMKPYYTRLLDALERNDERFRLIAPNLWAKSRGVVNVVWPLLKTLERR